MDMEGFANETRGALRLHFPPAGVKADQMAALKRLLSTHGGHSPVEILVGKGHLLQLPQEYQVDIEGGLVPELRQLLGVRAVPF
ncbi:MAG: hypothetical protein OXP08_07925, partial [bacterium]|nr:hypothetical protein [bacterium]